MTRRWLALALCGLGLLLPRPALAQLPPGYGGPMPGAPMGGAPMMGLPASAPGEPTAMGPAGAYPSLGASPSSGGSPSSGVAGIGLFNRSRSPKFDSSAPPPTLTDDGTPNAFDTQCDGHADSEVYFSIGPTALRRQALHTNVLAVEDSGVSIPGFPRFFDTGNFPPSNAPVLLTTNNAGPQAFAWGVSGTVGYRFGNDSIELSGFWLPQTSHSVLIQSPSQIDLPFATSPLTPIGFQGDNNLFLQADQVRATFTSTLYGAEANYRKATGAGFEWIMGVRYLGIRESYGIFVDDDGLTFGRPDPTNTATYTIHTNNQLVCPQLGIEGEWPIFSFLAIGGWAKGAWGPNFLYTSTLLQRGDGYIAPDGPDNHVTRTQFGQIYDVSLFADILITERIRMRGGWQLLAAVGVASPEQQISFDFSQVNGAMHYYGSIIYQGPMMQLCVAF